MGFYLELRRQPAPDTVPLEKHATEFREEEIPVSFWFLFIVAGFALACMGAAAFTLFGELWRSGEFWDRLLVGTIASSVPIYLLTGLKLFLVRKFVQVGPSEIQQGYRIGKLKWPLHRVTRAEITGIQLNNRRPTANLAPREHDNPQYYIRGHWRLEVERKEKKRPLVLDKHTEKEMLEDLCQTALKWWKA